VPAFSIFELGRFFHGSDNRSSDPLPIMQVRAVDQTTLPPQLFHEPLITVSFDDGDESVYKYALPLLQKYGIHSTQYVLGGTADEPEYVSWAQIAEMQKAGHEIACHTMTHKNLVGLNDGQLEYQIKGCKDELTKRFGTITDFASPYGAKNARTVSYIKKYFNSERNTDGDPTNGVDENDVNTSGNFNLYNIIGVTVRHDTTIDELKSLVDYAKAHNGWVVLTYHQADEGSGSQYGLNSDKLAKQFEYLSKTDVRIVTMQQALETTTASNLEY
jgi:peptidoglycan/xylan/chitin deacetylase (PgdA/CDA1 family)